MQSSNDQVIRKLHDWLQADRFCWLISIAATWGSSPRPAGSLLVWCAEEGALGSLSGGCVEDELLEKLRQDQFPRNRIHRETYAVQRRMASARTAGSAWPVTPTQRTSFCSRARSSAATAPSLAKICSTCSIVRRPRFAVFS